MPPTEHETQAAVFQKLNTTTKWPYSAREYFTRFAWEWVQRTLIRFSMRKAHRWRRFLLALFGAQINAPCGTKPTTRVLHPWLLTLGKHCTVSEGVTVYNLGHVTIGDHTVISQDVYICAGTHDYTQPDLPLQRQPITIGNGVWVCAGAFIGPGVTIGDNSVIGARAVVMKDVPPGVVVAGNPMKTIKNREMNNR